jgi:hypothetical protein
MNLLVYVFRGAINARSIVVAASSGEKPYFGECCGATSRSALAIQHGDLESGE